MNFIKLGKHRINLELVERVSRYSDGTAEVLFVGGGSFELSSNETALLLASIDGDEEESEREAGVICAIDGCGGWLDGRMICTRCGADHGADDSAPDNSVLAAEEVILARAYAEEDAPETECRVCHVALEADEALCSEHLRQKLEAAGYEQ